jgi:signal transduction histidine kinase
MLRRVADELSLPRLIDHPTSGRDGSASKATLFGRVAHAAVALLARVGPLPSRRPDWAWFRPSSWPNVALAVVSCGLVLLGTVIWLDESQSPSSVGEMLLVMVPLVLFAWRPRLGEWLLVASLTCWGISAAARLDSGADFPTLVAIYTIGTQRGWRRTAVALAATMTVFLAANVRARVFSDPADLVAATTATAMFYAIVAGIGLYLGKRRAYVSSLVERTENLERERDVLERERHLMAQQAVAVERARIARELHDVVAHHVSVMVIQAGAAQASLPPGADAAGQALEAIQETGREAMTEMRRLLGLLRSEEGAESGATSGDAGRWPQPGMTDLEALVSRTREAGVDVTLEVVGAPRHVPAGVELSTYRVAQEALTNTLRHAGPGARARLSLRFEPGAVALEVTDDGHGQPTVESVERSRAAFGHGLVGMRERVALFGGQLEVGPMARGGYRVMARFPLAEGSEIDGDLPGSAGEPNRAPEVRQ